MLLLFQKVFAVIDHHLGIWHKSQRARIEGDGEEEERNEGQRGEETNGACESEE